MLTFGRILFPVDFSEACEQTAPYVEWLSRKFGSQVSMLHVVDIPCAAHIPPRLATETHKPYEDLIRIHESELAEFARGLFDGLCVTRVVEMGGVAEAIIRYANRNATNLIVIPTHGLGTFRPLLLGSVTAKVLHDSLCPVWTTVHSEKAHPTDGEVGTIVCGVDIYSDPESVVRAASDMAAMYGAVARLVHAIGAPEAKSLRDIDAAFKRILFDRALTEIAKCQKQIGVNWDVCVEGGTVASVIRDAAEQCQADLVVIGRGHLQSRFGRFRTNVGAIIRQSPCPVLSV